MKSKQIKRSIIAILMIAVLMAGTSVVSVGAATNRTYLDDMMYSEIISYSDKNTYSSFSGNDYFSNSCERAMLFHLVYEWSSYPDEMRNAGKSSYSISYKLNGYYNNFIAGLTHRYDYMNNTVIEIYGDETLLFSLGMEDDTPYKNINIPVKGIDEITIKFSYPIGGYILSSDGYIIFDNAYLTSEGTTTEPPTKETEPNQDEPTSSPTNPVKPPVAPTTSKPAEITTDSTEDVTTATKATTSSEDSTSKINPTASPNATSKISTKDTATKDSANKGVASIRNGNSDNGTIQTGAISIAVILFVLLASLATGGFVWYRRKIK